MHQEPASALAGLDAARTAPSFWTAARSASGAGWAYRAVVCGALWPKTFPTEYSGMLPRERKRYTPVEIISRMVATLPADLVSSGKVASLRGNAVAFDRMPANRIMVAWEEGNEVGRVPRRDTDAEDFYHLGSAVYCDLAFVDKQTHERLVIAGHCPAHVRRN